MGICKPFLLSIVQEASMKRLIPLLFVFLTALLLQSCGEPQLDDNAFYISPDGNDDWSGRRSEPNADATDGPFATLQRAKSAIRQVSVSERTASGGITVYLRKGTYLLKDGLVLGQEDSGSENAPVRWTAYPDERVVLSGGRELHGFEPVSEPSILERLPETARDNVLQIDLTARGITDTGKLKRQGFGRGDLKPVAMQLIFNHQAMTLARYPNEGWLHITSVPQSGQLRNPGGGIRMDGIRAGRHYGRFGYKGNRPSRWSTDNDIWMHGYWTWDWADTYEHVDRIDTDHNLIFPDPPYNNYGYRKGQRFYFLNILEELDTPGEYYIDRDSGMLYFWPPSPPDKGKALVTLFQDDVVQCTDARHIRFDGFIIENLRGSAFRVTGGSDCLIAGCTFRNIGNIPVHIDGGDRHAIHSCEFYDLAGGAIRLNGGDRKTLTPAHHSVVNNHISFYGERFRTGQPAIQFKGVGNRAAHNKIHDAPHAGIQFKGNDLILEYNECYKLAEETGDVGAFYTGRDYTSRGSIIRYNYFHHLHGPGLHGVNAVYLDDFTSGIKVFGNIFYKTDRGAFIGGGRDNIIENNIFVDCHPAVHVDARGLGWAKKYFDGRYTILFDRLEAMNWKEPPFSERYPDMLSLKEDNPAIPRNNKIVRNVCWKGEWIEVYSNLPLELLNIRDNLIAQSEGSRWTPKDEHANTEEDFIYFQFGDSGLIEPLQNDENRILDGNPGFQEDTFRLSSGSPAFDLGFEPLPHDKIGLYSTPYRDRVETRSDLAGSL
jgi:hypothetical protein